MKLQGSILERTCVFVLLLLLTAHLSGRSSKRSQSAGTGIASSSAPSLPADSFRITFGLKDTAPRDWSGELLLQPHQRVEIAADEFRANIYRHDFRNSAHSLPMDHQLPNDTIRGRTGWICSSRRDWVREAPAATPVQLPSLMVHVRSNPGGSAIRMKTAQGDLSFDTASVKPFEPALFLNDQIRIERVPPPSPIAGEQLGQQDYPALYAASSGRLWVAWQAFEDHSDSLYVRQKLDDQWGPVHRIVEKEDLFRSALGQDDSGHVWIVWSMQKNGNWDLHSSRYDGKTWSDAARLTEHPAADIYHRLTTDASGRLWLVWQRNIHPHTQILVRSFMGGAWGPERVVSEGISAGGSNWLPDIAAGPDGLVAVAWDGYASGNYDIYLRRFQNQRWEPVQAVANTGRFEAQASVAIDASKRIWLAWHESGEEWGKDTGRLTIRQGTSLYESRSIRVVCFEDDRLLTTTGDLSEILVPGEKWESPHLLLDRQGHPWVFVRHFRSRDPMGRRGNFPLWEIAALKYSGARWSEIVTLPQSKGRNDMQPALSLDPSNQIWAAWPTDNRSTKSYLPQQGQVIVSRLPNAADGTRTEIKPFVIPRDNAILPIQPNEPRDVKQIRSHSMKLNGKSYSIYRGDLHRHTDISLDGGADGSLLDAYRYARDAADLDFLGVADHTHEVVEPYAWWRTQKFADLFQSENFAALYGYERSVEFPNGHRNIFFFRRGAPVLPIEVGESLGFDGSERLFWYLRRHDGTSIPHTTATGSGTDWRDHDPQVEHLLEIYQGARDTYEHPGAPRPKTLSLSPTLAEDNAPFRRMGTAWSALEKGYRLGFVASSDHRSTHISYACLIAESPTRESLLEAIRSRRAYAATDNIVLDVRFAGSGGIHLMGETFVSATPVRIHTSIIGTDVIQQVDIISNGKILYSTSPGRNPVNFEYVTTSTPGQESYYYVRLSQRNGEMAWGSPVWVRSTQ